ncbi:MAG TPA: PIN domain-containing protein [Nonomuraea sp.]|nr:PIN domain-containing protein [Nonomuraea sp.]
MIVVGPIVAAAIVDDADHRAYVDLFTGLHLAGRRRLISPLVVAEVCYMIGRESNAAETDFVPSIRVGDSELVHLTDEDLDRIAHLVDTYRDLKLGATDASVIAIGERYGLDEMATLDHRHFTVVRPSHLEALTLVP